ncbi:hypothetical protein AC781_08370 [Akkermansia glycaniphila]|nr:hypothetical protein AC781_08370 [Akkermansia glycaniphila]
MFQVAAAELCNYFFGLSLLFEIRDSSCSSSIRYVRNCRAGVDQNKPGKNDTWDVELLSEAGHTVLEKAADMLAYSLAVGKRIMYAAGL